jgi:2-octaprenyl-6-methoxyphenol hydroxylase
MQHQRCDIAVIGAGPAGLATALLAARALPRSRITVLDARAPDADPGADARTLALSLGSVQLLRRVGAWDEALAQPITTVHVSQAPPTIGAGEVLIRAQDQGQALLGAVISYGALVGVLERAWRDATAGEPERLVLRLGAPVRELRTLGAAVEVDADIVEPYDLAVVAEGGTFGEQPRRSLASDYAQTAWVGSVAQRGAPTGWAFERFTRQGPVALLPLPAVADAPLPRSALVWCVPRDDDPLPALGDDARLALLQSLLPQQAGELSAISPLKAFPLGLNAEPTLVHGRQVRIGNAAQTLHPVAGQGLNLALRDAHELVAQLQASAGTEQALRRFSRSRLPDRLATIALTDLLARGFTWRAPLLAPLRGLALAALQQAAPARGWLARQLMFGLR